MREGKERETERGRGGRTDRMREGERQNEGGRERTRGEGETDVNKVGRERTRGED